MISRGLAVANRVAEVQQAAVDRVLAAGVNVSRVQTYTVRDSTECGVAIDGEPVCSIFTTLCLEPPPGHPDLEHPRAEIDVLWAKGWR